MPRWLDTQVGSRVEIPHVCEHVGIDGIEAPSGYKNDNTQIAAISVTVSTESQLFGRQSLQVGACRTIDHVGSAGHAVIKGRPVVEV